MIYALGQTALLHDKMAEEVETESGSLSSFSASKLAARRMTKSLKSASSQETDPT
jgi:hypothetical protein